MLQVETTGTPMCKLRRKTLVALFRAYLVSSKNKLAVVFPGGTYSLL